MLLRVASASLYALEFVLEADILSSRCNKDDCDVTRATISETIAASHTHRPTHVRRYSVNYSNVHIIIGLTVQSDISHFPR